MKGLLIKDFKLLKNQRNFFIAIILVAVVFTVSPAQGSSFAVGYLTFVCSLFTLSTMSYDELDNGYSFLFTLPFTRTEYIYEKYCFGFVVGGTIWLLSSIIACIHDAFTIPNANIIEWWLSYFMILSMLLIVLAFTIPLHLKFGSDKGRICAAILFGIIFAGSYIIIKADKLTGIDFEKILDSLSTKGLGSMTGIILLVSLTALGISMTISLSIVKHKEF